jgi:hypothetical protein
MDCGKSPPKPKVRGSSPLGDTSDCGVRVPSAPDSLPASNARPLCDWSTDSVIQIRAVGAIRDQTVLGRG